MEGCGVTPSIPITTTITQTFQKTCPEWRMIKHRVKSPALLRRLMIVPPAIPHGRSDGFITAATDSRQKECISWGFKILSRETVFRLKHPHGHTHAHAICLRNLLFTGCPPATDHLSDHYGMMACCCQHKPGDWLGLCLASLLLPARIDLSGHRLTLHQLGGVSRLYWRPKEQIASSPNCG